MDLSKLTRENSLNRLLNSADLLASVINTGALVSPQEDIGFNGWLFHIPKDNQLNFHSEITDHYVESNKAVQDHISLAPVEYTVSGLIGELVWEDVYDQTEQQISEVVDKLPIGQVLSPELTAQGLQIFNTVNKAYKTALKIEETTGEDNDPKIYKNFLQQAGKSFERESGKYYEQQLAVNYFNWAWQGRKLFKIQTPWRIFDNMAIKDFRAEKSEESKTVTNISITFKQLEVLGWKIKAKKGTMGRNTAQSAKQVDKGTSRTESTYWKRVYRGKNVTSTRYYK